MAQLENHPECAIPHVVSTKHGLIITAQCGGGAAAATTKTLRLTAGHLVYTQRGLQAAQDLTTSDIVFSDLEEQHKCNVVSVAHERTTQQYFGLNCHNSQVLAS